jgi:kynureninase
MRPALTGWFAEFASLEEGAPAGGVAYPKGAEAFLGATYDPTSHYRAAAVFAFHARQGLTAERLHAINRAQVDLLEREFASLDLDPSRAAVVDVPPGRRGGFLAIRMAGATSVVRTLRARDVFVDARGDTLRLGPAPYVTDRQLRDAIAAVGDVLRGRRT